MCKQKLISNKFDLNLTTTLSSYMVNITFTQTQIICKSYFKKAQLVGLVLWVWRLKIEVELAMSEDREFDFVTNTPSNFFNRQADRGLLSWPSHSKEKQLTIQREAEVGKVTRAQCYKTFYGRNLRMYVISRSEVPFRCSTLGQTPGLTHKHHTSLEKFSSCKRYGLFYEQL
jgi:hypothetical protein